MFAAFSATGCAAVTAGCQRLFYFGEVYRHRLDTEGLRRQHAVAQIRPIVLAGQARHAHPKVFSQRQLVKMPTRGAVLPAGVSVQSLWPPPAPTFSLKAHGPPHPVFRSSFSVACSLPFPSIGRAARQHLLFYSTAALFCKGTRGHSGAAGLAGVKRRAFGRKLQGGYAAGATSAPAPAATLFGSQGRGIRCAAGPRRGQQNQGHLQPRGKPLMPCSGPAHRAKLPEASATPARIKSRRRIGVCRIKAAAGPPVLGTRAFGKIAGAGYAAGAILRASASRRALRGRSGGGKRLRRSPPERQPNRGRFCSRAGKPLMPILGPACRANLPGGVSVMPACIKSRRRIGACRSKAAASCLRRRTGRTAGAAGLAGVKHHAFGKLRGPDMPQAPYSAPASAATPLRKVRGLGIRSPRLPERATEPRAFAARGKPLMPMLRPTAQGKAAGEASATPARIKSRRRIGVCRSKAAGAVTERPARVRHARRHRALAGGPAPAALTFYQTPGPPRGAAAFCARTPARIMRQKIFARPDQRVYMGLYCIYRIYTHFRKLLYGHHHSKHERQAHL